MLLAPEARHRRCVQLLGRWPRARLRGPGFAAPADAAAGGGGRLALDVLDRERSSRSAEASLTDLLLELIPLLTHGLRLDEQEGLLRVDRLDLFGQSGSRSRAAAS